MKQQSKRKKTEGSSLVASTMAGTRLARKEERCVTSKRFQKLTLHSSFFACYRLKVYDVRRNNERPVPVCGLHVQKIRRDDSSKHEQVSDEWDFDRHDRFVLQYITYRGENKNRRSHLLFISSLLSIISSWQRLPDVSISFLASFHPAPSGPSSKITSLNHTKPPTNDLLSECVCVGRRYYLLLLLLLLLLLTI